jgi:preprotein translocase subunit Sec63
MDADFRRLGVSKKASLDDIKRAYYKKAITCHPDKGGDPDEFQELVTAYERLSRQLSYGDIMGSVDWGDEGDWGGELKVNII